MMSVFAVSAPLLIQGAAAARDTVYVKAVGPDLGLLGDIQAVSTAIIMLVMVLMLGLLRMIEEFLRKLHRPRNCGDASV